MNGYLKVNTFIRDIVFTNCQNLKTIIICFDRRTYTPNGLVTLRIETQKRSIEFLRIQAEAFPKKQIISTTTGYEDMSLYNSYVTRWLVDTDTKSLYIWSSNIPERSRKK